MAIALGVLLLGAEVWFMLALYSGVEQLGARSHPVVDGFAWVALAVVIVAAVVLCVETIGAVLRRLNRRSQERQ